MIKPNIYKSVKSYLDAREVVKNELGEPIIKSGKTWKWHSPFRPGDNDPSLCADKEQIKDFGGDFYGDIFNFISELHNISNSESLDYITKKYGFNQYRKV